MKNKLLYILAILSFLSTTHLSATLQKEPSGTPLHRGSTLDDILSDPKTAEARIKSLAEMDPEGATELCNMIKDPDSKFYDKANEKGMGVIKSRALMRYCVGYQPKVAQTSAPKQKEREKEKKFVMPKLRPVKLSETSKTTDVSTNQFELKQAKEVLLENAKELSNKIEEKKKVKLQEIVKQLVATQLKLDKARERYDNLTAVIIGFRFDAKEPNVRKFFKVFNPDAYDDKTPEAYLGALNKALPSESQLTKNSRDQIAQASKLLAEANENLKAVRFDLVRLNREMLELTNPTS